VRRVRKSARRIVSLIDIQLIFVRFDDLPPVEIGVVHVRARVPHAAAPGFHIVQHGLADRRIAGFDQLWFARGGEQRVIDVVSDGIGIEGHFLVLYHCVADQVHGFVFHIVIDISAFGAIVNRIGKLIFAGVCGGLGFRGCTRIDRLGFY